MKRLAWLTLCSILPAAAALDRDAIISQYFGNDGAWYHDRIPLLETSSTEIQEVYYYRWNIFRAHQRDLGAEGYISTEFINDVGWQTQPSALLIDASNFHLREGRWCRDRRFKQDYSGVFYGANGNPYQFSEAFADGVWQGYLVDGVVDEASVHLDAMQSVWDGWNASQIASPESVAGYDSEKSLFYIWPIDDATEYTIASIDTSGGYDGFLGGSAFRPSINSYQFANAHAIANLAELSGNQALASDYRQRAASIKQNVQDSLWNDTFQHFVDRYKEDNENVTYWDYIRGRELVGYLPWTHDLPDDDETYAAAWSHLMDEDKFAGPYGLRTVEPSYEYYMRVWRYEGTHTECHWNGPLWFYQTTQVLTALANLLDHYPTSRETGVVTNADYTHLLQQYAERHYNPQRGGILDAEENYDADTGLPIVGLARSPHYFHSGYIDNVLAGFVGIRPRADDVLEVNPLADASSVSYFRAEGVLYHGHDVSVQWDASGDQYGTAGLVVEVDGAAVATSPDLTRLTVNITREEPVQFGSPTCISIQQGVDTEYPVGSVSVANADANAVHAAIDGRVWFFPESDVANGWDSPVGDGSEVWFQVDFGTQVQTGRGEIAFFADDSQGFAAPGSYRVEVNSSGSWVEVSNADYADPLPNGITEVSWDGVETNQIRLLFTPEEGAAVRLVEFKVFEE
ncbi:hypothetical protein FE257_000243 [Aspergillus nanangensis]|uniref:F5/8 type C domain-containing protein n=1 Tax=Aspergillus nanangensis TaxID=2582783 RepID=A0AAD4CZ58_ASPNN|nr:hypothetical protein FE257_000243 [Aspergillus nanangensis]